MWTLVPSDMSTLVYLWWQMFIRGDKVLMIGEAGCEACGNLLYYF